MALTSEDSARRFFLGKDGNHVIIHVIAARYQIHFTTPALAHPTGINAQL